MEKKSLIRIIVEKLFCSHDWEEISETKTYTEWYHDNPTYIQKTLCCEKCGKIKKIYV